MRIVVAGGGLAGVSVCQELRAQKYRGDIVLLDQEATQPYDRPPLSKQLLQGLVEPEDIRLPNGTRLAELGVDHRKGVVVSKLVADSVALGGGDELRFDGLVIATGSAPRRLPGQPDVGGVHTLRTLEDAMALRRDLQSAKHVVVVGGGFIGLEVAASAVAKGIEVTVVERGEMPLSGAIGPVAGGWLTNLHRSHGVRFICGTGVAKFFGENKRVQEIELDGGERLRTDVVVIGVGAEPVTGWLAGSSVRVADGVVCDAGLRAGPRIYAAGDVARWEHPLLGPIRAEHWSTAVDHAQTVAANLSSELVGGPSVVRSANEIPYFWTDQYDVKLQVVGCVAGHDRVHVVDDGRRRAILYGRGESLVAALALNQPAFVARHRKAIAAELSWGDAVRNI
ncbi:FAD-dependent oxidoreductase [Rhodococcus sp. IEGM 1307]|uniref:NAD(P)/FAD-dependent oxidoreductase n=1 Tax=Rhodococcus sp. IEGM 1307 TaxID=3047091 RepID=UPI0024B68DBF|nr:FAD-dependent oxidoreductase [Rhodococcus sp. IEGM 1307]MDI9979561.1 FAD-dependent oxidoreductase [Rhodococcus sp. IEGM 1307]